ncbi:uncharacterized protein [Panulirus ornatus]|uniref:uncharacterized protein n=1 Tax=Panulirus ornatus TaxID=150431 RepID=UPI003A8AFE91
MSAASLQMLIAFLLRVCLAASQQQQQLTPGIMQCVSEGRFPHPEDCGSFVDCLPDGMGGVRAREGSCNGLAYYPTLRKCVSLNEVNGCQPRSARALVADPKLDFVCEGSTSEFVCADCKTLVNCVNGTAYPEPCGSGDLCALKDLDFGGGVCYPSHPPECTCEKPNQFKVDLYNVGRFFFCEHEASEPTFYDCPEDHVFDSTMSQCRNYAGLPECTRIGVFANTSNCTEYYTCIFTTTGWLQKSFSCNNETQTGFMYNEESGRCEDPCSWDTGTFSCSSEGRFPNLLNCHSYYECINDLTKETGFRQILHECPEGHEWDPNARQGFGHCVRQGSTNSVCVPLAANKCTVPNDQCLP